MTEVYGGLWQPLVTLYAKVLTYRLSHLTLDETQAMATRAAIAAMQYAKAHPYEAGFAMLNTGLALIFGAGWLTAPLLQVIGFGPLGPVAGKQPSVSI